MSRGASTAASASNVATSAPPSPARAKTPSAGASAAAAAAARRARSSLPSARRRLGVNVLEQSAGHASGRSAAGPPGATAHSDSRGGARVTTFAEPRRDPLRSPRPPMFAGDRSGTRRSPGSDASPADAAAGCISCSSAGASSRSSRAHSSLKSLAPDFLTESVPSSVSSPSPSSPSFAEVSPRPRAARWSIFFTPSDAALTTALAAAFASWNPLAIFLPPRVFAPPPPPEDESSPPSSPPSVLVPYPGTYVPPRALSCDTWRAPIGSLNTYTGPSAPKSEHCRRRRCSPAIAAGGFVPTQQNPKDPYT